MHWSQFGWFMNDWWSALYIMTRRHHILGISWTNIRVSNFKILQPLSSWHRGTSCLWVQVMPFLHLGSLLRGQVKLLTLEKNLGPATRPGDEPVPGKNKEEGRKLGYRWSWTKAQLSTPPLPEITLFSGRGGEPNPSARRKFGQSGTFLQVCDLEQQQPWFQVFKMYSEK